MESQKSLSRPLLPSPRAQSCRVGGTPGQGTVRPTAPPPGPLPFAFQLRLCAMPPRRSRRGAGLGAHALPSPGNGNNRGQLRAPARPSVEWWGLIRKTNPGGFPEQKLSLRASGTRKGGETWGQDLDLPRTRWTKEWRLVSKAESPVGAPGLTLQERM